MNKKKIIYITSLVAFMIVVVSTCILVYINKDNKKVNYDLNGDGINEELMLIRHKLVIYSEYNNHNKTTLWKSDAEWKCDDLLVADINRDGKLEVLLLLWKEGSYGDYVPFWDEQDNGISQHIFIYNWNDERERIDPIWMSSKLYPEVKKCDMTEDGRIHIVTPDNEDTYWIWGSWGLERVDYIPII